MRNKKFFCLFPALMLLTVTTVWAADALLKFSIEDALRDGKVSSALIEGVKLYWGDQSHPGVVKEYGEYKTSKRTNGFGKSKETACRWALATSLKVLQKRALREGGNAVINIKSNIKNKEMSSAAEYECLAGSFAVNSALKGTVVKLSE